jgi:Uma2 family endonuclease
MAVTRRPVMAKDCWVFRTIASDASLYVRGEVRTMARAGDFHGRIVMNASPPLDQHVRANGLGVVFAAATGFKASTNPDSVRAPDAAFVPRKCVDATGEAEGYWPGAPDLAVGVVSPNDRFAEIEQKVADWFAAGTLVVVVVNAQSKTFMVRPCEKEARILSEGEVLDHGEVVPGWTHPVAEVFR